MSTRPRKGILRQALGLAAVSGVVIAGVALTPASVEANSYDPVLPKTAPATSVVVVDLTDENDDTWRDFEAQVAALVIQGIVNRTSSEKIYLVGANYIQRSEGDLDLWALQNDLVPVPRTDAQLDRTKEFPALSYLMDRYGDAIEGQIRYPALVGSGGSTGGYSGTGSGAFAAALTAAGQTDGVALSPYIASYLAAEGHSLPVIADTTGLTTRLAAHEWAVANYFTADTTRDFIAKYNLSAWGGFPPDYLWAEIDYWVSSRAFVLALDGTSSSQAEVDEIGEFLQPSRYPYATQIIGDSNGEGRELEEIHDAGYTFTFGTGAPNFSVYSSFPSDPSELTPPAPTPAYPVSDDEAYVAFYFSEGDNLRADVGYHLDSWAKSPIEGQVPIAYTANPVLLDTFPTFAQWRSENTQDGALELMLDFNDGISPNPPASQQPYIDLVEHYYDNANGTYQSLSVLGGFDGARENAIIDAVDPVFAKVGYQGGLGGNDVQFATRNDGATVVTYPSGATGNVSAADIRDAVRYVVDRTPAGQPAFVLVAAGGGNLRTSLATVREAMYQLENGPGDRTMRFVKPSDLATQYKVAEGLAPATSTRQPETFAPQPATGQPLDRSDWYLRANPVNPRDDGYYALDDDEDTRYTSVGQMTPGMSFTIDMGTTYTFDRVELRTGQWSGDHGRAFDVQVSDDATTWRTVATAAGAPTTSIPFAAQTARHLRVVQTGSAPTNWSVSELDVFAADAPGGGGSDEVVIDLSHEGTEANDFGKTSGQVARYQTFTTDSSHTQLRGAQVKVVKLDSQSPDFGAAILPIVGGIPSTTPIATVLVPASSVAAGVPTVVDLAFPTTQLTPGTRYAIALGQISNDDSKNWAWFRTPVTPDEGFGAWTGTQWVDESNLGDGWLRVTMGSDAG